MSQISTLPKLTERLPSSRLARLTPVPDRLVTLFVAGLYLTAAVVANWPAWSHGISHTIQTSGATDVQEEVWFLAQTPWAIIHGINPFGNGLLNAPVGVNLMDNTSMLLLGLIGAPITLLAGPLATFNVLLDLGFATSAMAFYIMARRFVGWNFAAFVGGLLYGFSPFAVAAANAHLFLVFNPVPPLVVLFVDRTIRTRQSSPIRGGIMLGLCLAAQFYISTEMFASLAVMVSVAVGGFLAYWLWRRPSFDMARLLRFGGCAAAVCALCVGYGAWMALGGPNHISGPAQSRVALAGLSNDPIGLVVPTIDQRFTGGFAALGDRLVAQRDGAWRVVVDSVGENGSYIGIPLLCLLLGAGLALRRRRVVQVSAAMAGAAMVLSLGARLHVDGRLSPIRLPFDVLAHLPLLDSSVASRYAVFFWLFASVVFGVALDSLHSTLLQRNNLRSVRLPAVGTCLVALVALVPLVPAWPYRESSWHTPAWFRDMGRSLPSKSTVLIYPMASPNDSSAMVWQADAHMAFKMPGGYAVFRSASGPGTFVPETSPLQSALALCAAGTVLPLSGQMTRTLLHSWHINYVVVPDAVPDRTCATTLFGRALGAGTPGDEVVYWRVGG